MRTYFNDTGSVGGMVLGHSDQVIVAGGTNTGSHVVTNFARYLSGDEARLDLDGERVFLKTRPLLASS